MKRVRAMVLVVAIWLGSLVAAGAGHNPYIAAVPPNSDSVLLGTDMAKPGGYATADECKERLAAMFKDTIEAQYKVLKAWCSELDVNQEVDRLKKGGPKTLMERDT